MLPKLNSSRPIAIGSSGVSPFAFVLISLINSGCNGEQRKGYTSKDTVGNKPSRVGPHLPNIADIKRGIPIPPYPAPGTTILVHQDDKCRYRFPRNTHYWWCNPFGDGREHVEIIIREIGHLGNVHLCILPIWIRSGAELHDDPLSTSLRSCLEGMDSDRTSQIEVDEKGTSN